MTTLFNGAGVAIVTPFLANREVDYESLKTLIDHVINGNISYIVVLGTTGESVTLTNDERQKIFSFVAHYVADRVPLVAGIGGNATLKIVEELSSFDLDGYSAILSVSPYYNKPTQQGIYEHYRVIASSSRLPIILYNVPGRTACNMTAETTIALSKVKNIIGIKEASGDLEQIQKIIDAVGDDFFVTSGDDMQTPIITAMGGVGVISVLANAYPSVFNTVIEAVKSKKDFNDYSWELLQKLNPLMYTESNPVGIKALLSILGLSHDYVRLPLIQATPELKNSIANVVRA